MSTALFQLYFSFPFSMSLSIFILVLNLFLIFRTMDFLPAPLDWFASFICFSGFNLCPCIEDISKEGCKALLFSGCFYIFFLKLILSQVNLEAFELKTLFILRCRKSEREKRVKRGQKESCEQIFIHFHYQSR